MNNNLLIQKYYDTKAKNLHIYRDDYRRFWIQEIINRLKAIFAK